MKIFVGSDHRGFKLKKEIIGILQKFNHDVVDVGSYREGVPCDYPKIALAVGKNVVQAKGSRGILICMTGFGQMIAANKVPGAYAAVCYNKKAAYLSRAHNNTNILVLSAKFVSKKQLTPIITTWLKTPFEGGRHARRVRQIKQIEKMFFKKATN